MGWDISFRIRSGGSDPHSLIGCIIFHLGLSRWCMVKNLPANAGDARDMSSIRGLGRFPGSRKWQPILVFLPGKSHGQRTWCTAVHGVTRESDVTDCTCTHTPPHNLSLNLTQVKALILTRIIID